MVYAAPPVVAPKSSVDRDIVPFFKEALTAISKGEIAKASEALVKVRMHASSQGFKDIPEFSLDLIRRARDTNVSHEMKKLLYDHAERLSPDHPGVLLSLATAHKELGFKSSFKYFNKSISNMKDYPVTLASTLARLFVMGVCALCITIFLVTFLFLVSTSGEIYVAIATMFSKKTRGYLALVLFPLFVLLPLVFPFLFTLCVWAVFMPLLLKRLQWISFFTGGLVLSFVYGVPFASEVMTLSELKISKALESVTNKNYMPRVQDYLDQVAEQEAGSPMYPVFRGKLQQERGDLEAARASYESAMLLPNPSPAIAYVVQHNLGVYAFQKGDFQKAYSEWEKLYAAGWREFELVYNLSIVSLSLFKKEHYETYYELLLKKYPGEVEKVFEEQGETPAPLLGQLPRSFFIDVYKDKMFSSHSKKITLSVMSSSLLIPEIGGFFDARVYVVLSCVLFLVWIYQSMPGRVSYRYRGSLVTQRVFFSMKQNGIWKLFPFGWCLVEGKELFFLVSGSTLIFLVMVAFGVPFSIAYESVSGGIMFLVLPALLLLLVSVAPWKGAYIQRIN